MKHLTLASIALLTCSALVAADERTEKKFPAYPVPDEIIETPVANSALLYAGMHAAAYQNTGIPSMLFGLSFFLREFFSARAEILLPLKKSELDGFYAGRASDLSRNEPVQLRAGGNMRLLKLSAFFFYVPALAGLEVNRNQDEAAALQTFVDLGAGVQAFISGLYFVQLEYTYHFSNIPLRSGYYIDHNYNSASLSFGLFF